MTRVLGLMTCYNRREKTVNSIEKLISGNPGIQFSFIVADDNSKDGTKEALEQFSNVQVLRGDGNLYYSGGMRLAISEANKGDREYDYCLLFNDDVDFFGGSIEKLAGKCRDCVWVGPTCDTDGKLSYGGVVKVSRWRPTLPIVKSDSADGRSCDTFNANCVLIPWDIFRRADNIDNTYTHAMGDYDYGFSFIKSGVGIKVSDSYVGVCCDNPVKGSWRDTSLPRKERLRLKESPKGLPRKEWFHFLKKNYSVITAIVYSVIPYLRIVFRK